MLSGVIGFYGQKLLYRLLPLVILTRVRTWSRLEPERRECLAEAYRILERKQIVDKAEFLSWKKDNALSPILDSVLTTLPPLNRDVQRDYKLCRRVRRVVEVLQEMCSADDGATANVLRVKMVALIKFVNYAPDGARAETLRAEASSWGLVKQLCQSPAGDPKKAENVRAEKISGELVALSKQPRHTGKDAKDAAKKITEFVGSAAATIRRGGESDKSRMARGAARRIREGERTLGRTRNSCGAIAMGSRRREDGNFPAQEKFQSEAKRLSSEAGPGPTLLGSELQAELKQLCSEFDHEEQ